MRKGLKGFTLIELMIVVAIIAIIASIAIPNLLSARVSANETAAIATLRNLASAQAQVQAASAIDEDADGAGEYGTFGEMSGAVVGRMAALLVPPVLSGAFGNVQDVGGGEGGVSRSGFFFKLYLPGPATPGEGIPEGVGGGVAAGTVDINLCEVIYCAYAWPINRQTSGNRAFFVNQAGDVLQAQNDTATFSGTATPPPADEAFLVAGVITGQTAVNAAGQSGEIWTPVQ